MNFAVILFIASIVLGLPWLADKLYFAPQRRAAADAAVDRFNEQVSSGQINISDTDQQKQRQGLRTQALRQPLWLEYTAGFFPVIVVVFLLRSFLFEPFKIPSGSMLPTLFVGDLILVNKFDFGVRIPIINKKIIDIGSPKAGDVMVFRFPPDPSVDYIKRVVGVPGDLIEVGNQRVTINGKLLPLKDAGEFIDAGKIVRSSQHLETLGNIEHKLLTDLNYRAPIGSWSDASFKENCSKNAEILKCKVPAGHYFMMGDNRDNSADSRFWGFVPDENIVGRAFFIWMNFGDLGRIGSFK